MKMLSGKLGDAIFALAVIGLLAYGCAALVTVFDILGRRVGMPVEGVVDLVQLFVMAGAWLVMPYAFYSGAHVGVDFIIDKFPARMQKVFLVFGSLIAIMLLALMLWYGYTTAQQRIMFGDKSQELGLPILWYWVPLLLGMAGSIVASILVMFKGYHRETAQ